MLPERVLQRTLGARGWTQRGWAFTKSWRLGHLPPETGLKERKFDNSRWEIGLSATPIVQHRRGKRRFSFVLNVLDLMIENNYSGSSASLDHRNYGWGYTRVSLTALSQRVWVKRMWIEWHESEETYVHNRDLHQEKWAAMKAATLALGCSHLRWGRTPERPHFQQRTVAVVDGVSVVGVAPDPSKAGEMRCNEGDCKAGNGYSPTTYYFTEELMSLLDTPYKKEAH